MNSKLPIPDKDISVFRMPEDWQAPYMYRRRIEGECELFELNGVYPNENDPYATCALNLQASCDENGYINKIEYYKIRDSFCGHGRPQSDFSDLNAADKKLFSGILDKSTISRADSVLPGLIERAKSEGLPGGWSIKKSTAVSVTFSNDNGSTVAVSKSRILKYLEVSYCYIEILSSGDFWDANPRFLKPEDKEPMLALFSLVDTSGYYNLNTIRAEAEKRAFNSMRESGYRLLCQACENGDLEAAENYAIYAKPDYRYMKSDAATPLHTAIKSNNLSLAKLLLENRAPVNSAFGYKENGKYRTALELAIETENDEAISLLMPYFDGFETSSILNETIELAKEHNRPELAAEIQKTYDARMEELKKKYCKQ